MNKIWINSEYRDSSNYIQSIPEIFDKEGTTIYKSRNEIKVFDVNGEMLNVKSFKIPILINRIIYTFIRPSKAERSYLYANELLKRGFSTPKPVACMLFYRYGLLQKSYYISQQLSEDFQTLYDVEVKPVEENKELIVALVEFMLKLHAAGIYHKDFSPGNILYRRDGDQIQFCLVDLNRMHFGPVSVEKGCSNFSRLWGKEDKIRFMVTLYAKARNADPEKCIELALIKRRKYWERYKRKRTIPFEM